MATIASLVAKLGINTKEFDEGIERAEKKGSGFGQTMAKVGTIAGGIALGGALQKAPGFFLDAANAAAEDAAATARLETTLKSLGGNLEDHLGLVDQAITAGQALAFSDDDVRDSFQFLAQATGDVDEALRRQRLAMDLARGANIPLGQATKMLGKLNEENIQTFKKLGITIAEGATEAEAMAAVQAKFAGQAEAYGKSTAGQFAQAKLRMGELKETIGGALLPALTVFATVLATKVFPALETTIGFITEHEPLLYAVSAAIGTVLVAAFIAWAVSAAMAAAATIAATWPILAVVAAVALLVAGVMLLIKHWDDITAKFPILGRATEVVQRAWEAFIGWLTGSFVPGVTKAFDGASDAVKKTIDFIDKNWSKVDDIIELPLKNAKVIFEGAFKFYASVVEGGLKIIEGLIDVFVGVFTGDWDRAFDGVKKIVSGAMTIISGSIEAGIGVIAGLGTNMKKAAGDLGDAFLDGFKAALSASTGFAGDVAGAVLSAVKNVVNTHVIDRINSMLSFTIKVPLGPDIKVDAPDIPHLAAGTRSFGGGLAVLGERGPELAALPGGTRVFPASQTADMLGGSAALNINGPVTIVADTPKRARRRLNDLAYGWGAIARAKGFA